MVQEVALSDDGGAIAAGKIVAIIALSASEHINYLVIMFGIVFFKSGSGDIISRRANY